MDNQTEIDFTNGVSIFELKQKSYHNTTNEKGKILSTNEAKAKYQDEKVLEYFKLNTKHPASPTQVWRASFTIATPLTSVRRSFTNLTKAGFLEKTEIKIIGNYGRQEYQWKLKN